MPRRVVPARWFSLALCDVRGLRTLRPTSHLELHLLAFPERLKALAQDCRVVDKHVLRAILGGNEPIPLLVAEPLHGTLRHKQLTPFLSFPSYRFTRYTIRPCVRS